MATTSVSQPFHPAGSNVGNQSIATHAPPLLQAPAQPQASLQQPGAGAELLNNASSNYPPSGAQLPGGGVPVAYGSGAGGGAETAGEFKPTPQGQPKRLHVSNIPFRFREQDLRQLFFVSFRVCVSKLIHVDTS